MKSKGLTLIEVLVSIVIFAVALAGGMAMFFYLNSIASRGINERKAVQLADSKMEELQNTSYANLVNSTVSVSGGTFTAQQSVTVTNMTDALGGKQIRVLMSWHEPGRVGDEAVDLVTVRQP